jgi:GNAT superfamily N-acetyltransferase
MTIRAMTAADIPAGMRLCEAAGWNQLEPDWAIFLHTPRCGAFLAESEGRVFGTVAYLRYGSFGWIAMMLVDPAERRSGIGSRLMEAVVGELADCDSVGLDATPLGEPLYRRFGLVNQSQLIRAKTTVEAARFQAGGRAHAMSVHELARVLARDRDVFGADLVYLLRSLFERAPECAWVVMDAESVRGYCFGRPGRLYHQLGPVVAQDRDAARELVAQCLDGKDGRRFAIDVPLADPEWLQWLTSAGFEVERPFERMFREGGAHPGLTAFQYAIAGPEFA